MLRDKQVLIPHFTGDIVDTVVESGDSDQFRRSSVYLVLASIACAAFSGIRYLLVQQVFESMGVVRRECCVVTLLFNISL